MARYSFIHRLLTLAAATGLLSAALPVLAQPVLAQQRIVPESPAQVQLSYAPLVKQTAPSVVNVYTKRIERGFRSPFFDDPFFRFFGDRFPGREREVTSLGSGVIVGADGVIVTNNHVIEGADEITVILADKREFTASLVLADERTDLAVLRIDTDGKDLPALTLADSDRVEVGDIVFAIGNPFGVGQTVTSGIVSAIARTERGITDYEFFIQTDAAINPGNSGGALIGIDGKLIGINTAIYSRTGASNGIGFAIPANMVSTVITGALSEGRVIRPWLGASTQAVTSDIAQSLGLDIPQGVLVNEVYDIGPAAEAGLKSGDVILAVDDHEVGDPKSLSFRLATQPIGTKSRLKVLRGDKQRTITLNVEAPPMKPDPEPVVLDKDSILSGATLVNLSPALADELRLDPGKKGVAVKDIDRRGMGARLGLRPGDILVSVNGVTPKDTKEAEKLLSDMEVRRVNVEIERGGRTMSVTLRR